MTDVFDRLVGQQPVVAQLREAAVSAAEVVAGGEGRAMTHAWLFTGPPGSGRSTAARAFAAALQCTSPPEQGGPGCGHCHACHTTLAGTSADVRVVVPEGLSIPVALAREMIGDVFRAPAAGRFRVVLVEDADRLVSPGHEQAANVLLKAVEEPPRRGVFLLCAPSVEDVLPTIRSRCRHVALRLPSAAAVTGLLVDEGVDLALASYAAAASQGHVGRARRLAGDETARRERRTTLTGVPRARSVPAAYAAAKELVEAAKEEAVRLTDGRDERETSELREALGAGLVRGSGRASTAPARGSAGALSDLERRQKSRATRAQRDALDRALVDLAAYYRDVLVAQLGAPVRPVHGDLGDAVASAAGRSSPAATLQRIEAVLACREAIDTSVNPLLAVEDMAVRLVSGG